MRQKNSILIRLSIETGAGDFFKPAKKLFKQCGFEVMQTFCTLQRRILTLFILQRLYKIINIINFQSI